MPFAVSNQTIAAAGTLEDSFVAPTASRPNDFTPLNPSVVNVVNVGIAPPAPTTGTLATTIEYAQGIVSESVAEYGVQETPVVITLLETLEDAALLAEYLIRSAPAFWFGNIQIIMNGLTDAQRTIINNLDIGSQISVTKTFPKSTPSTVTQLMALEGISHDITPDRHIVTLYPNPARIYTYFIVGGYPVVATRTNLIPNPNFEVNTTGWELTGTTVVISRITSDFYNGVGCAQVALTNPTNGAGICNFGTPANRIPVSANTTYTISAYVKQTVGGTFQLDIDTFYYNAAGGLISSSDGVNTTLTSGWTRITRTITTPALTTALGIDFGAGQAYTGSFTYLVDAIMLEETGSALPYFDGTYVENYAGFGLNSKAWNGVADASTSTATWYQGATRTNLVTNPNFETNATNWFPSGAASPTIARTTTQSYLGTASLLCTATASGGMRPYFVSGSGIPVTVGTSYTLSAYTKAATVARSVDYLIDWYSAGGTFISSSISGTTTNSTSAWTRATAFTAVAPANASFAIPIIRFNSVVAGEVHYLDAVLFEQTASALPYFDGTYADTYAGYTLQSQSWSGTANASTSTGIWGLTSAFVGSQLDDDTKGLG